MKVLIAALAFSSLSIASPLRAADLHKPTRAIVNFDHPENFSDIKDSNMPSLKNGIQMLDQIRQFIVNRADYYIPEGYQLTMTFTDFSFAGKFDPAGGPQAPRIVRPLTPPYYKFAWAVTGPQGQIVKQGKEDLSDLYFDARLSNIDSTDPFHYEKAFSIEWMVDHLADIKRIARGQ